MSAWQRGSTGALGSQNIFIPTLAKEDEGERGIFRVIRV